MAKKKAATKTVNKSDAIRKILAAQPGAKVKEIQAKLDEQGVKASIALVNKIKYGGSSANKSARRNKTGAAGSKASAIRAMFTTLGSEARPRDVIAALKGQGIAVTSAQVSMLRHAGAKGNGHTPHKTTTNFSLDQLLMAKQLAERLGGIPQAQQALNALARLV